MISTYLCIIYVGQVLNNSPQITVALLLSHVSSLRSQSADTATKLYSFADKQTLCSASHAARLLSLPPSLSPHLAILSVCTAKCLSSALYCVLLFHSGSKEKPDVDCKCLCTHIYSHSGPGLSLLLLERDRKLKGTGIKVQHAHHETGVCLECFQALNSRTYSRTPIY